LTLTADERETLERWARRPTTAQALAQRARIVLQCATGRSNDTVAREMGVTRQTVGRWRQRFVTTRVDGLLDEPRPGAPHADSRLRAAFEKLEAEIDRVCVQAQIAA